MGQFQRYSKFNSCHEKEMSKNDSYMTTSLFVVSLCHFFVHLLQLNLASTKYLAVLLNQGGVARGSKVSSCGVQIYECVFFLSF